MNETNCRVCGKKWHNATFLSETFSYSGGNMVFTCECGEEKTRGFIPIDLLTIKEQARYIMKSEGMSDAVIESALARYDAEQSLKKIQEIKL